MSRLHDIITDAIEDDLSKQDAGRDVMDHELATAVERAIVDASGGPDHIVRLRGYSWVIQHPIAERFEGKLFDCHYTALVEDAPFEGDGVFRVWIDRGALLWDRVGDG